MHYGRLPSKEWGFARTGTGATLFRDFFLRSGTYFVRQSQLGITDPVVEDPPWVALTEDLNVQI